MLKHFRIPGRLAVKLEELGVSVSKVLRKEGLPRDLFQRTRVLVSTAELFALWRAIDHVSSDPLIGIKLGIETKTERFHPMAIAALSTDNLVAASRHMARFKKLTAPEEIVVELDEAEFKVSFRWLLAVEDEPVSLIDYCFSWVRSLARHGSGTPLNPLRVEYVQRRLNMRQLERSLGCTVLIGAPQNAIVFRAVDATKPFATRNAELLDLLAPQFEEQLRQYKEEDSFLELVRRTIQDKLPGHRPSINAISRSLHMGPRTLQRRLQDSGSSYQRLLDEARHQMARYYLGNSALELNEAAYLLGFEDPNSFGRAFRNWEGVAPIAWREAHRSTNVM